jgi:transcriptional regulator with XRE-family HTH domain
MILDKRRYRVSTVRMTPAEFTEAITSEVRAEMGRQRKSQSDMAKALEINPATARRRLNGESPFDTAELFKVALWLGVDVENFYPRATQVPA